MLTNEQAKQEAIKKAYCNDYDIFKPNENGIGSAIGGIDDYKYETVSKGYVNSYRPKSLKGIENNNGWIRIEPDGSNLPEKDFYEAYLTYPVNFRCNSYGLHNYFKTKDITHYKPITPEKPPVY